MQRERLIELLKAHEDEIRGRGVTALSLFGSAARGENRAESDVDLLVDIDPDQKFSLFDLVSLKHYLSDLIGQEADITQRSAVHRPRLKQAIDRDEVSVFR